MTAGVALAAIVRRTPALRDTFSGGEAMRLAQFIIEYREPILMEWETFARTCGPASGAMDVVALRDHADEMLMAIAADLQAPQSDSEQSEKAKGRSEAHPPVVPTAAEEHGSGRADSGFTVEQMISEYRALRASVIRLWTEAKEEIESTDVEDMTRFNEAIDQALAESIARYTDDLAHSKEMFLAILGHDLRTPLGAILTSAQFMLETEDLEEPQLTLMSRIALSSDRMLKMVGDLLDFTRSRLGGGIPITREETNVGKLVHDVVDEITAAHPSRTVHVEARGEHRAEWDAARVAQALSNLIGNAVEHGYEGTEVTVEVDGDEEEITLAIHNRGVAIPAEQLDGIFNPMKPKKAGSSAAAGPGGGLGLGLYIAERIVTAHQGRLAVDSSEEGGTTFTVHLPRQATERRRHRGRGRRVPEISGGARG